MAPVTEEPLESLYLPSLDKCLNGESRLLSWKQAYEALSTVELAERSPNLRHFLEDEQSINVLSADLDSISRPTAQTKSDFEAKTAAVNVTPSHDGHFDIQQVKDDTLWLSKQVELDEVSALRIVVLEWQARPVARVLEGYTEEEIVGIKQVVDDAGLGASILGIATLPLQQSNSFDSDDARRNRLLLNLLSERQYVLEVSYLLRAALLTSAHPISDGHPTRPLQVATSQLAWLKEVLEKLRIAGSSKQKSSNPENRLSAATKEIESAVQGWVAGGVWSASLNDPLSFEAAYRTAQLRRILSILKLSFAHLAALPHWPSAANVQAWFALVDQFSFLELLQPQSPDQEALTGPIQALISLVSLQVLRLPQAIAHISGAAPGSRPIPYISDQACRQQVDDALRTASQRTSRIASPTILAWSIILQNIRERSQSLGIDFESDDENISPDTTPSFQPSRKSSSDVPSSFASTLDAVSRGCEAGDPIDFYARTAIDHCNVLVILATLSQVLKTHFAVSWNMSITIEASLVVLELARQTLLFTSYSSEIVETVLVLLDDDNVKSSATLGPSPVHAALAAAVTKDHEILIPKLLYPAQQRYPYELGPFLRLIKALATPEDADIPGSKKILPLAEPTNQFTQQLPIGFTGYELVREDENTNGVRLTEDLRLFLPRRKIGNFLHEAWDARSTHSEAIEHPLLAHIPAGTTGTVVNESTPFIVAWDYRHSAIQYLASLLSSMTPSSAHRDVGGHEQLDTETQSDIIGLLAKLIEAYKDGNNGRRSSAHASAPAMWILEEASDGLGRNQDIISVVFEIFEEQLSLTRIDNSGLLVSCVEFFTVTLSVLPGRIWPLLARSELLQVKGTLGHGGRLVAIIGSADAGEARSALISAVLTLFDALVDNSLISAVSLKKPSSTVAKRFINDDQRSARLPDGVMSNILLASTQASLSIFESAQKGCADLINCSHCLRSFNRLFTSVYNYGDDPSETPDSPSSALVSAARLLSRTFIGPQNSASLKRLISAIAAEASTALEGGARAQAIQSQLGPALEFISNLLSVAFQHPTFTAVHLQKDLFQSLPILARIYMASDSHKRSLLSLLSNLVRKAGASEQEPPSLLGSLGSDVALAFMSVLQHLGRPLGDADTDVKIWDLAAAVVSNKQQWFASFLINGEIPRRSSKESQSGVRNVRRRKAMLTIAVDYLATTTRFEGERSIAMLRFVVQAQNHWPKVSTVLRRHERLVDSLLDYVTELRENLSQRGGAEQANQVYATALIADLLAMYIHNLRQHGISVDLEAMSSKFTFYRENGLLIPTYNQSLHKNLKRNFESLFSGCKLDSFKRAMGPSPFGKSYYYDITFAGEVLGEYQAWNTTKGGGLEEEFARANLNLSLVEAEISLTKSWESLLIELSHNLKGLDVLQKQLIGIASQCLEQDINSSLHEVIFESLQQRRIDLALVLLQRLVNVRSRWPGIKAFLRKAWEAVRHSEQDFETAFSTDDSPYYRSTLQVLLLALQPWTYVNVAGSKESSSSTSSFANHMPPEIVSVLLEITTEVVCKGFRSLSTQLHSTSTPVDRSDFALILGILQTIIRIPGITAAYTQLTLRVSDTGVHRFALALFSWSDRLVARTMSSNTSSGVTFDPFVYADISITFLRELTNIPPYAEYLATEGVLSQLSTTPLLARLQAPPNQITNAAQLLRARIPDSLDYNRLTTIFATAILPLTLNLLTSVGSSFAQEAVAFLSSFPTQLSRASSSLRSRGPPPGNPSSVLTTSRGTRRNGADEALAAAITLTAAGEVHTLCLIDLAIAQALESPSGIAGLVDPLPVEWDRGAVREELDVWLGSRRTELRMRIVPESESEEALWRRKAATADEGCENALEEAVVRELRGALAALGVAE